MTLSGIQRSPADRSPARVTAGEPGAAVEAEGLDKVYPGGRHALTGVSFSVDRGEIFGFLGPNGSGKTTAVRIFATLLRQTSGTARVGGFDTRTQPARVRELVGYAGQSVGVDDDLTVAENLAFTGFLHGVRRKEAWRRAAELIEQFSLADAAGQRAARLSGGLRRRLDLAQALVHRPSVIFLDEPTTGLDPQSRKALWEGLRQLSHQGVTVFLTTQYLEEADRACDRIAILDQGTLVRIGTPAKLKDEVGGGRVVLTIGDPADRSRAADVLATSDGVVSVQDGDAPGGPLVVHVRDAAASVVPIIKLMTAKQISVGAVEQAEASLDDVFLRYTGDRPRAEPPARGAVSSIFAAAHGRRRQ
jgi:daunorubicin resistance ABC transporter ATP-binding subunit